MFDLDAYLARIGFRGSTRPDLETLAALHESQVGTIPFENLDVLLAKPILLDSASLMDKMVRRRRGGYCFEQNLLLHDALTDLGFDATMLAARLRLGQTQARPRTHALLLVRIGPENWIADVGFGRHSMLAPIRLQDGARVNLPLMSFRVVHSDGTWILQADEGPGWADLYSFTLEPVIRADYEMANYFTSTYPQSVFTQSFVVSLARRERRLSLFGKSLKVLDGKGATITETPSRDGIGRLLADSFGLDIDPAHFPARLFE